MRLIAQGVEQICGRSKFEASFLVFFTQMAELIVTILVEIKRVLHTLADCVAKVATRAEDEGLDEFLCLGYFINFED